jgi:hypothetical protein
MAKGDNRAVVGSSGRPLPGMVLESGTKQVAQKLGKYTTHKEGARFEGAMQFDMSSMVDHSIDADPSRVK